MVCYKLIYHDSNLILYADDTALIIFSLTPQDVIQKANKELEIIYNYCFDNQLLLNYSKCKVLVFNNKTTFDFSNSILIKDTYLEVVDRYTYLGYTLDFKLSFKYKLDLIFNKIKSCNCLSWSI